jgi:hypothetical protein
MYHRLLGDVNTRATSTTSPVSKVIPLIRITNSHVVCRREFVVEITIRYKIVWIWIALLVIMYCPPVEHNHRTFGDEMTLVPVILNNCVIHTKLVDRTPAEEF